MPKGIKKERSKPRAIPPSQSVLYRTIKKALPDGLRFRDKWYSHRDLLGMLRDNADARHAESVRTGDSRPSFPWAGTSVFNFYWGEVQDVPPSLWSDVNGHICNYFNRIEARKADKKGDK